jgi:hypothetical protein
MFLNSIFPQVSYAWPVSVYNKQYNRKKLILHTDWSQKLQQGTQSIYQVTRFSNHFQVPLQAMMMSHSHIL